MTDPANDPRALLRMQRQHLLAYATPGPGDGAPLCDLPEAVSMLVRSYERAHPATRVDVYWYAHLNGSTAMAQGDVAAVPDDDDAVVLSATETMLASDATSVTSYLVLGRQLPSG